MHENMDHTAHLTFEGKPPHPTGGAREDPRKRAQGDIDSCLLFTTEGPAPNALPQPNIARVSQPHPMQPLLFSVGEPPLAVEGREKLDLIEERLRAVEGFRDYPFANMTDLLSYPNFVWGLLLDDMQPLIGRFKILGTLCCTICKSRDTPEIKGKQVYAIHEIP